METEKKYNWWQIGTVIGVIVILILLFWMLKWQHDLKQENLQLQNALAAKQLPQEIIRSQTVTLSEKQMQELLKQLNIEQIQNDLDKLNSQVKGIQVVTARSSGVTQHEVISTKIIDHANPKPPPSDLDPYGYQKNTQIYQLREPNKEPIPLGQVEFSAWKPKPWNIELYSREYQLKTVIGEDEEGKITTYNQFSIEVEGKKYLIPLKNSVLYDKPQYKKFYVIPHLQLGINTGFIFNKTPEINIEPDLNISFFGYGKNKNDLDFTFLGIGLGYAYPEKHLNLLLIPVSYNIGHHLPLMNNLFLGPFVSIDYIGLVMSGLGIYASL